MASLVADILSSAGKLEREELGSKITTFCKRLADIKLQVHQNLQTRYVDFVPIAIHTSELDKRVESCYNELKSLDNLIETELLNKVQESAGEFEDVSQQLAVAKTALNVVRNIVAFHESLDRSNAEFARRNYPESVRVLLRARTLLDELRSDWDGQIHSLDALGCDYVVHSEKVTNDLRQIWNEHLRWTESNESSSPSSSSNYYTSTKEGATQADAVRFRVGGDKGSDLQGVVQAMNLLNYLDVPLRQLATSFRTHLLRPIVSQSNATVTSSSEGDFRELCLSFKDNASMTTTKKKKNAGNRPNPTQVFASLTTVFEFAGAVFGSIKISDEPNISKVKQQEEEGEEKSVSENTLTLRLGDALYDDLCRQLIGECLAQAVPTARRDLSKFERVTNLTVDFQSRLVRLGFVRACQTALLDYARNVDALFADKACREIIARARQVALRELYEATQAPVHQRDVLSESTVMLDSKSQINVDENSVSCTLGGSTTGPKVFGNLFAFPTCQLSKSVIEFVEMLYEVLDEASSSSPLCSGRLFETARNIVALYCTVVPCHHRDNLDAFPQQSALFHNNCMYIAHHLLTLGHQYKGKLSLHGCDELLTFVDLVPKVRDIGTRVFLSQMQLQKKQLLTVVSEVGGFHKLYVSDTFFDSLSRAVKKCMLQLDHLKRVWQEVLPDNVYCKAMGSLVNSLIEEIICQTVQLEDLSADSAYHLIDIFSGIKEMGPNLFQNSSSEETRIVEVQRRVPKWSKFVELIFLLDANLQSILDRWASGKGPLAQEFSTDEVKKIIRALFQNTDIRASVLAKIK